MIKLKDLYPNQVSFNKKKYFGEDTVNEEVDETALPMVQALNLSLIHI